MQSLFGTTTLDSTDDAEFEHGKVSYPDLSAAAAQATALSQNNPRAAAGISEGPNYSEESKLHQ